MTALSFFTYAPSGNMTVFIPAAELSGIVLDEAVYGQTSRNALATETLANDALCSEALLRSHIARTIMQPDHLGAEQVGYIMPEADPPRLDMMGGELCVNACRAMAALLLRADRLPLSTQPPELFDADATNAVQDAGWRYGYLASSGVDSPLVVRARPAGAYSSEAGVCLRMPQQPQAELLAPGIRCVRLPGIVHLVLDAHQHPFPDAPHDWRTASAALRQRFGLEHEEAVGCLWLYAAGHGNTAASHKGTGNNTAFGHDNAFAQEDTPRLVPTVWVQATDEPQLETACGSGSLACALCLFDDATTATESIHEASAFQAQGTPSSYSVRILQYGGEVVEIACGKGPHGDWHAWISGEVRFVAQGTSFIPPLPQNVSQSLPQTLLQTKGPS